MEINVKPTQLGLLAGVAFGGGQQGNTNNPFAVSDQVSELEINVKPTQLGLLAGVAFGISLLSVFLASIGILRLNPRKILLN